GQGIRLCGGTNIFGELDINVPVVSQEAVVRRAPDVIFYTQSPASATSSWVPVWERLLPEAKLIPVDPDLISRPGLRMLDGINLICEKTGK
ncbi:MAG: hypothetical protein KDI36_20075, partial [Pseudomonadales bacterium]|nr:hypothetical protein [Pseudomonadales bacterium]